MLAKLAEIHAMSSVGAWNAATRRIDALRHGNHLPDAVNYCSFTMPSRTKYDLRMMDDGRLASTLTGTGCSMKDASTCSRMLALSRAGMEKLIGIMSAVSGNAAHWSEIELSVTPEANGEEALTSFPLTPE